MRVADNDKIARRVKLNEFAQDCLQNSAIKVHLCDLRESTHHRSFLMVGNIEGRSILRLARQCDCESFQVVPYKR